MPSPRAASIRISIVVATALFAVSAYAQVLNTPFSSLAAAAAGADATGPASSGANG